MHRIIFLVGPTASGKTEAAVSLAKKLGAEIISCDSMQVYRSMDILSQKPSVRQRASAPHYMVGILNPSSEFNVADYKTRAERIVKKIIKKGKKALIVGGSGLYVKALVDGLFPSEPGSAKLRAGFGRLLKKYGKKYLHNRLKGVDPETAEAIHPNNVRRVIRALEICLTSKATVSQLKKETRGLSSEYDIVIIGLRHKRSVLYERINKRVDRMFRDGVVKEVRRLKRRKISQTASAVLGYKEVSGYLDGKYSLNEAKRLLKRNTRRFAKRQLSWFRKDSRIKWIDADERKGDFSNRISDAVGRME